MVSYVCRMFRNTFSGSWIHIFFLVSANYLNFNSISVWNHSIQVLGESAGSMLGRDLESLVQRAREYKKEYGDSFVSVEHLVLGFTQDQRFGKQLFKEFQISLNTLTTAIQSIRGRQTVIDQGNDVFCCLFYTDTGSFCLYCHQHSIPWTCFLFKHFFYIQIYYLFR